MEFTYGSEVSAYSGCGVTLRDKFWYFGGLNEFERQVSPFFTEKIYI